MVQGYVINIRTIITFGLLMWIIIRIIILILRKKSGSKILIGKEIMTNLFAIYILCLVGITLFPIAILKGEGLEELKSMYTLKVRLGVNIFPFRDYIYGFINLKNNNIGIMFSIRSILGNILLLSPLIGYLLMYKEELRNIKNVIIISFLISLSIELFQLIENLTYLSTTQGRTVNIDDLILNTISGILAYYIFKLIYKTKLRFYLNMN